jgi:hypothetical protein
MKKYGFIVLLLSMIFSAAFVAHAEGTCTVSLPEVPAKAGDTVAVNVTVQNNPGIASGNVKITYDHTKIIPVSAEKTDVLQNAWYFTSNLDDPSVDASELDYMSFSWMNTSDLTGDGTLATVLFEVREDVQEDIPLSVSVSELSNAMQKDIVVSAVHGKIKVGQSGGDMPEQMEVKVSSTTVTKSDSFIGGNVTLSVYSPQEEKVTFIFTVYDSAGTLAAVTFSDKSVKAGINEVELSPIHAAVNKPGTYAVKIYSWDSINGMKPVVEEPILNTY